MNDWDIVVWGFGATVILTVIMSASKPIGLTRMDLPFLLGTLVTPNRDRAPIFGFGIHLLIGWFFTLVYAYAFHSSGLNNWWFGAAIGVVHGAFVLSGGLALLGAIHPRMANPFDGPTPTKELQPPGFFAVNYGKSTAVVTMFAHLIYGTVLGAFL